MKVLEETRNEWLEDMKCDKKVTKRERKRKFKKKELFKREINEIKYRTMAIKEEEQEPGQGGNTTLEPKNVTVREDTQEGQGERGGDGDSEKNEKMEKSIVISPEIGLGYYLDMQRGFRESDLRILTLQILDDCVDKMWERIQDRKVPSVCQEERGGWGPWKMG